MGLDKPDSCISGGRSSHEGSSWTSTGCLVGLGAQANVATLNDLGDCLNNGYLVLSNVRKVPFVSRVIYSWNNVLGDNQGCL